MLSLIYSAAINSIEADIVVYFVRNACFFSIVGLPDAAVKESCDRVTAAMKNLLFDFPSRKITVNLALAYIKKECSIFDLSIALEILAANDKIRKDNLRRFVLQANYL